MTDYPLHISLINASAMHSRRSWQEFQKLGLTTGQPKVLSRLYACDGCLQKDLADYCKVEPATITVILQNMIKHELIRKEATKTSGGKRAYKIFLTELGLEKAKEVDRIVRQLEVEGYKDFSDEEKQLLSSLLGRVTKNLSENS